jgi:hypothetical protein
MDDNWGYPLRLGKAPLNFDGSIIGDVTKKWWI